MNFNYIAVIDTETTAKDETRCAAVQLAAKIIDGRNLEPVVGGEFNMFMKPYKGAFIDPETVRFHANLKGKTQEEILADWETYPDAKIVWPEFLKFLRKYHTKQTMQTKWTAPVAAGANILNFDLPILNRYNIMYGDKTENGVKPMFHARDKIEMLQWFFIWFENNGQINSYSMDNMREYFGMSKDGAHDALVDVQQCSEIIIRFMKLQRGVAAKVKFKDAFR